MDSVTQGTHKRPLVISDSRNPIGVPVAFGSPHGP